MIKMRRTLFFLIKAAALTILIIRITIVYAGSHSSVYMKELPHNHRYTLWQFLIEKRERLCI